MAGCFGSSKHNEHMTVLVFEDNLMWSVRFSNALKAAGHEAVVLLPSATEWPDAQVGVINLGHPESELRRLVFAMRERGVKVLAHAGHKEGDKLGFGRELGADKVVTNSEITHKLPQILESMGV